MQLVKKLNFKKFIPLTLIVNIFFLTLAKNKNEILVIFVIYIAGLLNLSMLYEGINEIIIAMQAKKPKVKNLKVGILFFLKLIILIGAITWGVQTMQKRIIIPIFNYIIHIFMVPLCIKKDL